MVVRPVVYHSYGARLLTGHRKPRINEYRYAEEKNREQNLICALANLKRE